MPGSASRLIGGSSRLGLRGQDERILTLLEIDAFHQIHQPWRALGYPFDSLVPSYATAISVSGDTPQALASPAGILVNQGVRNPVVRIEQLHFAQARLLRPS